MVPPSQQGAAPLYVRRLFAALSASFGRAFPHGVPCLRCALLTGLDAREAELSVLLWNPFL